MHTARNAVALLLAVTAGACGHPPVKEIVTYLGPRSQTASGMIEYTQPTQNPRYYFGVSSYNPNTCETATAPDIVISDPTEPGVHSPINFVTALGSQSISTTDSHCAGRIIAMTCVGFSWIVPAPHLTEHVFHVTLPNSPHPQEVDVFINTPISGWENCAIGSSAAK